MKSFEEYLAEQKTELENCRKSISNKASEKRQLYIKIEDINAQVLRLEKQRENLKEKIGNIKKMEADYAVKEALEITVNYMKNNAENLTLEGKISHRKKVPSSLGSFGELMNVKPFIATLEKIARRVETPIIITTEIFEMMNNLESAEQDVYIKMGENGESYLVVSLGGWGQVKWGV